MLRISSSSGRWQVGTWKTDHFDLKLQVMLHFQPLPPFFLTLTVTVRRCELALNLILYIYSRNQGSHFQKKNLQNSAYSSHLFQIYIILFLYMSTTWSCKFRQEKPSISFVEVLGFWHWQSARGTSQESLLFFLWEMSFPQVLDGQGERIRKISSKTKRASWKIIILSRIYFKLLFFYCHGGVVPLVIRSISPSFSTLIQTFGTKQSPSESESCLLNFREHGHYKWVYTPYK